MANEDLLLAQLLDMGYTTEAATVAIRTTRGEGLNEAVGWLLENPDSGELAGQLSVPQDTTLPPPLLPPPRNPPPPVTHSDPQEDIQLFSPLGAAHAAELQSRMLYNSGAAPSGYGQQDTGAGPLDGWLGIGSAARQPQASLLQHMDRRSGAPGPQPVRLSAPSGVGGLLAREQQKAAAADRVLDTALQDLQGLMQQAHKMVELAEQLRQALARAATDTASEEAMAVDLSDDLVSMGIAAPVTKESAGKQYHIQLARQLADFLRAPLERVGGLMTLPDVFCLFNRARGVELISPDDLLAAVKRLPAVGAPIELRELADGVRVLQSSSHSIEQVCARIAQLVHSAQGLGPALSVSNTADALQVPLAIAQQHLLTAESCGTLCRDDGPDGLRWFDNFFREVAVA